MNRRTRQRGFTLLELVLVMLIACTALAIAAPKLGGFRRGAALRSVSDQFLTLTRLARTDAISNATVYRIQFDTQAGKFWLLARLPGAADFTRDTSSFGRDYLMPEGGRIELTKVIINASADASDRQECIDFFPTGRAQPATVKFSDGEGSIITVQCLSPSDDFHVVSTEDKR